MISVHSSISAPSKPEETHSLAGMLLVASPMLAQTPFAQSVIYICAHAPDTGTMGLVVNKRLAVASFDELLAQLDIQPMPPVRRIGLCAGGPVDAGRGLVLHSAEWEGENSLSVSPNVALTGSVDVLKEIAAGKGPQEALLAMGHASWTAGQLEEEILQHDAWLVAPATRDIVFGGDHAAKWRRALASINIDPLRLSGQVGHA